MTVEGTGEVFALGVGVSLHLIGAPEQVRAGLEQGPHVTWHASVASAWGGVGVRRHLPPLDESWGVPYLTILHRFGRAPEWIG
jgi:hypothetical protein